MSTLLLKQVDGAWLFVGMLGAARARTSVPLDRRLGGAGFPFLGLSPRKRVCV